MMEGRSERRGHIAPVIAAIRKSRPALFTVKMNGYRITRDFYG